MSEQSFFIKRLSELIEEKDITQRELAEAIQITEVSISRYLSGERCPRLEIVTKIADFFDVSTDYLLGKSNFRKNPYGNLNLTNNAYSEYINSQEIGSDDELLIGLSREEEGLLTKEDKEKIREFAQFIISKRKGEK